ncbi:MAG TPA: DUF5668 domain-containing protein [Candidatus Atribacteria bacterium]|nr:DUF5668 domain-containing protein [Candidatus Atribacteria bacterium]HPT79535.1 DUF5668 domain-containing protein [Candidatus Atribacteria bacterium]
MGRKTTLAIILILLGIVLILNQTTDLNINLANWWPSLIIIIAAIMTLNRSITPVTGIFIALLAALVQLRKFDILITEGLMFPCILILAGLWIIFSGFSGKKKLINRDFIDDFSIFSGLDTRINSDNFMGGSVTALFGGASIDLRDARLSPNGGRLDLTAVFGGVEVRVPEQWNVIISGTPVFGAWENKARNTLVDAKGPVLRIQCTAVFGGVEVKN